MAAKPKLQIAFCQGWNCAVTAMWNQLEDLPHDALTPDQQNLKGLIFDYLRRLFPDEHLLKPAPTNAELAEKYAVSPRTITNWRKEGCPFEDGQWRVLDWMAERRYVPATAKAKFARQLESRNKPLSEWDLLCLSVKALAREVCIAKKLGLLRPDGR